MSLTVDVKGHIYDMGEHIAREEAEALIARFEGKISDIKAVLELSDSITKPVATETPAEPTPTPEEPSAPAAPAVPSDESEQPASDGVAAATPADGYVAQPTTDPQPIFSAPQVETNPTAAPVDQGATPVASTDAPTVLS